MWLLDYRYILGMSVNFPTMEYGAIVKDKGFGVRLPGLAPALPVYLTSLWF